MRIKSRVIRVRPEVSERLMKIKKASGLRSMDAAVNKILDLYEVMHG